MILNTGYKISIADWSVDSSADPRTELVTLEVTRSLEAPVDSCRLAVYAPPPQQASLLEQAASAAAEAVGGALGMGGGAEPGFSISVRGAPVKPGDTMSIELTAGDRSAKVITAHVQAVQSELGLTRIFGRTGQQALAETRLNQVYENQTLGQIVRDLAEQAGVETGSVDEGVTYSYFVVHESRSLLQILRQLTQREGLELFFDSENRLIVQKFEKSGPDHTFYYGIDVLELQVFLHQPASERLRVTGESPASNQGSETWHWLVKDLEGLQGEVGQGNRLLAVQDGALRTKGAADGLATARLGALKDGATRGRLKLLGYPPVQPGDAIEIKNAPRPEHNGLFKVLSLRHVLSKRDGFVTWLDFSGQGGAEAAEGLLGQAAALAGALGL